MNKVTTVNLNGRAFQVEEQAFDALRAYLDEAARLLADDPDCKEIMADLEQAIGDKGSRYLRTGRNVLGEAEMKRILEEMGPVETGEPATDATPLGGAGPASGSGAAAPRETSGPKRLYLVEEGAMIAGVCNGLAAYFGVDPTIVRLVFVVLLFLSGGLIAIAYLVLMFIVPTAKTPEERAAARGLPFNAQELVEQAKRHYADLKASHQRWRDKRRRKQERAFWRPRERRGYEPPHSRPFEQPQPGYGARVAAGIVLPLIGVVSAVVTVACLITLVSLLTTGDVLGWRLPPDVPAWAAILVLAAAYAIVTIPLRAVRYASYEALGPRRGWFVFWDGVLWLALVILAWWIAARYVPGVGEFFRHLFHDWRDIPFDVARVLAIA
ncbi:MAG TPA: PspC domain-containing protein [Steroidobacteraceae bacterium]|nr:PspC domain-containing protein [Steroidobacteraceae bacterium]